MRTDRRDLECVKISSARYLESSNKIHTWQEGLRARIKHTDCSTSYFSRRKFLFHWREFVDMETILVLSLGDFFFPYVKRSATGYLTEPAGREIRTNIKLKWKKKPYLMIQMESCALGVNAEGSASTYIFI